MIGEFEIRRPRRWYKYKEFFQLLLTVAACSTHGADGRLTLGFSFREANAQKLIASGKVSHLRVVYWSNWHYGSRRGLL